MLPCGARLRPLPAFQTPLRTLKNHGQFRAYRQYRFGGGRPQYTRFQATSNLFQRWAARPTFYRDVGLLGLTGGGVYVYNLEEVPVRAVPSSCCATR